LLRKFKKLLITPLIYGVAILLLFEQWLWRTSRRVLARFPLFAIIARLEAWISSLSPYAALAIFVAPSLLLIPVKVLALLSMTHGHPTTGVLIVLVAKVLGTALVARLYGLTEQSLSSLPWFVRWRDALLRFKDRMIAQLHATVAWQRVAAGMAALHAATSRFIARLGQYWGKSGRLARWRKVVRKWMRRRDRE